MSREGPSFFFVFICHYTEYLYLCGVTTLKTIKIMKKIFLSGLFLCLTAMSAMAQVNVQLHYDLGSATNPDTEDGRQKVTTTVEMFKADKLGSTFFFIDFDYRSKVNSNTTRGVLGSYWEISRDFTFAKVKDSNFSFTAHGEYNGGVNLTGPFQQCLLVGPALQWHNNDFRKTFTFQALYKQMMKGNGVNGHASFQTTAVWGLTFADDWCSFSGFADLWYAQTPANVYAGKVGKDQRGLVFLSEPQFWVNVLNRHSANNKLSVGTEWELSNNFIWYTPVKDRKFYWNPTIAVKWSI